MPIVSSVVLIEVRLSAAYAGQSARGRALLPSPGTPGEGRGEGSLESRSVSRITFTAQNPHPALSRSTGRGKIRRVVLSGHRRRLRHAEQRIDEADRIK